MSFHTHHAGRSGRGHVSIATRGDSDDLAGGGVWTASAWWTAIAAFMESDQFQAAWIQANRALHTRLVAVLRGDSAVIQSSGGVVAVNVFPLIAKAAINVASAACAWVPV